MAPEELVRLAAQSGILALSLTDHDTMDGVGAALEAAALERQRGHARFVLIPGVEISAVYKKEIHILGYFLPDGYMRLSPFIEMMKRERTARNYRIIDKLNALGLRLSVGDVEAEAKKSVFGRPHIAAALTKKGYVRDINHAFHDYLSFGKKAYAAKLSPTPSQSVAAISEAGGAPVIAHPVRCGLKLRELRSLAATLLPFGLQGIEAHYVDNTPQDTANYVGLARELGLIATGGSDFHGEYKKGVRLGTGRGNLRVPDAAASALLERLQSRRFA
jgi:predicted metal-dependent phosphoesterase TrpH